ncbi:MAG: glycosyltransferase [Planctomycetes bacterium]|nr:glycosyltransferase [Planctomycetota bacterium]
MLLRALLDADWRGRNVKAFLDARARDQFQGLPDTVAVVWCEASLLGRLHAEIAVARLATAEHVVLCLHNLPPLLPSPGTVHCFVQNANLVGLIPPAFLGLRLRLRCFVERAIAHLGKRRVARYVVQTPTMREALLRWYGPGAPEVLVEPFLDLEKLQAVCAAALAPQGRRWDFIYVSDGPPHKNHRRLFQAWRLLAEQGEFPRLALTLHPERDTALRAELSVMVQRHGLRIEDLGQMAHGELLKTYHQAGALLFPSFAESFGIPLIEAAAAGLPILAPELDYVRDVCDPVETFDPHSERSIARAVRRHLHGRSARIDMRSPAQFIEAVLQTTDKTVK